MEVQLRERYIYTLLFTDYRNVLTEGLDDNMLRKLMEEKT